MTSSIKQQCPRCAQLGRDTHGDNLVVFETSKHCFACGYHEGEAVSLGKSQKTKPLTLPRGLVPVSVYPDRPYLSEVAKDFGILADPIEGYKRKHKPTLYFPYFSHDNHLTGLKVRNFTKDKSRGVWWLPGSNFTVFGLHMLRDSSALLIVEGESDTLCLYSIFQEHGIDCDVIGVSGTGNVKQLKQLNLLDYEEIFVGFDSDDAGEAAFTEALEILPEYKVRKVSWTHKDPCETFEQLGSDALLNCLELSTALESETLMTGAGLTTAYLTHLQHGRLTGFVSAFPTLDKMLGGSLKRGETLIFGAHTGLGKSTFVLNWCYSIVANNPGVKCLWAGSEMNLEQMVHKLLEIDLETPVEFRDDKLNVPFSKLQESLTWVEQHFLFYNGISTVPALLEAATQAVYRHEVGVIVVDVLDDFLPQKWEEVRPLMKALKDFAQGSPKDKRLPVSLILISHTKQRDGRYSAQVRVDDLSGGVQRIQQATCVIGMDGVIGEAHRLLKILKLPRMGDSLVSTCEVQYFVEERRYEELA